VLNFLPKADCGKTEKNVNSNDAFKLSVSVVGNRGFTHDCSTKYDPAIGVAEEDCLAWMPGEVLSNNEGLDITLLAHDADGKQAACMKWELAFDGRGSGQEEVWAPGPSSKAAKMQEMLKLAAKTASVGPELGNNTEATRIEAFNQYLDSMTQLSHRCVPAGKPDYYNFFGIDIGFPPTAHTELQLRLSHAMLASTGMIWSIDRSCQDDLDYACAPLDPGFGPGCKPSVIYDSCIGTIPFIPDPHCHLHCHTTWKLGPGGFAGSWSMLSLSHHIPSPGISLVETKDEAPATHNDLGCGDPKRTLV
jgi:hypothetical protein